MSQDRGLYGDGISGVERRLSERIERLEKAAVLTERVLSALAGIPPESDTSVPAPSASPTGQSGVPLKAEERSTLTVGQIVHSDTEWRCGLCGFKANAKNKVWAHVINTHQARIADKEQFVPPAAAAEERCKCGHPRKNHSFYEDHDECGLCDGDEMCDRFLHVPLPPAAAAEKAKAEENACAHIHGILCGLGSFVNDFCGVDRNWHTADRIACHHAFVPPAAAVSPLGSGPGDSCGHVYHNGQRCGLPLTDPHDGQNHFPEPVETGTTNPVTFLCSACKASPCTGEYAECDKHKCSRGHVDCDDHRPCCEVQPCDHCKRWNVLLRVSPPPAGEAGNDLGNCSACKESIKEGQIVWQSVDADNRKHARWWDCKKLPRPTPPAPDPAAREQEKPTTCKDRHIGPDGGTTEWASFRHSTVECSPAPDAQHRRTWTLHVWPDHPLPDVCMMEGGTCGVEKLGATLVTVVEQREGERLVPDTGERVRLHRGPLKTWNECLGFACKGVKEYEHRDALLLPAPDSSGSSEASTAETSGGK